MSGSARAFASAAYTETSTRLWPSQNIPSWKPAREPHVSALHAMRPGRRIWRSEPPAIIIVSPKKRKKKCPAS